MSMIIIYYYEIYMKDDNDFDGNGWLKYWQDFACHTQNCVGDNDDEKVGNGDNAKKWWLGLGIWKLRWLKDCPEDYFDHPW